SGRYLFVVNNTLPDVDPGFIWRTTLGVTTRVPLAIPVKINTPAKAVYDVFAMKPVALKDGAVLADLRGLPARVYALLPAAIGQVEIKAPKNIAAGQAFSWSVQVEDDAGKVIDAAVPIHVRFVAADGSSL